MMPKSMKQLAIVQFFSWFALFAMWIYSVAGITSHTYDMKMDAAVVQELSESLETIPKENTALYENVGKISEALGEYEKSCARNNR
ncbi:MAG: hypothetical protein U5L09_00160 [Bacteroidales bacterium]|nr:hypothetical protein [Bacteroidales bacterium]